MTSSPGPSAANKWVLPVAALILGMTAALGWMTYLQERARTEQLVANTRVINDSLGKVQAQLNLVSGRLTSLTEKVEENSRTAQAAPEPAPQPPSPKTVAPRPISRPAKPASIRPDPRVDQLQTRLAGQEKALESTREQLESAQRDLETKLGTTKDELSGSIARTHEELTELRRRGERNYYEFDLFKNKAFSRIGPLGLSLRKADTKRRSYQVKFRLDDQELEKKNVNLFEPILISAPDSPQPLQLVVNQISKDRIRGYVSEPKVKQPAVAQTKAQPPALQTRP